MSERAQLSGQTPHACPFVAFEDDRDRRADAPDPRHRCYAEPVPQPRALAHQQSYCLSPGFPACPIFLDWAARAAADPIHGAPAATGPAWSGSMVSEATAGQPMGGVPGASPMAGSAAGSMGAAEGGPDASSSRIPDPAGRDWAAPPPWVAGADTGTNAAAPPTQMPAFPERSTPPIDHDLGEPDASRGMDVAATSAAAMPAGGYAVGGYAGSGYGAGGFAEWQPPPSAEPGRLSGRPIDAGPPPRIDLQARPPIPKRVDSSVGWSKPRRSRTYPALRSGGLRRIPPVLLAVVVLGIAAVLLFLLPGLLNGVGALGGSPTPSGPVVTATPEITSTPAPTPRTYTVKSGDTLSGIARSFGLTVDQLGCYNSIRNPNQLQVGQILLIPPDSYQCPPKGAKPTPSPSG